MLDKQTSVVNPQRRAMVHALPALGVLGLLPCAFAQSAYPNRALRVIVPQPPGGGFDFVARVLAEQSRLKDALPQPPAPAL